MSIKPIYCVLASAVFFMAACSGRDNGGGRKVEPVRVRTLTMQPEPAGGSHSYSGTVEAANGVSLSFPTMGTITGIHVEAGEKVSKGQLIATLNPLQAHSSYNAAKSQLEQAEDAYGRMKTLHDKGSLAEVKWVEIQSKLQQARAMEEIARKSLADCRLYAPFAGVVAEKTAEQGQNAAPGVQVVKLVTAANVNVKIAVPETEISGVNTGCEATIWVAALNGQRFAGRVVEKGVVANAMSRCYDVKIRVDVTHADLLPGMVAEVQLAAAGNGGNVFVVPAGVMQTDEHNRKFVWVADKGRAARRMVECGAFTARGVTIRSGVAAGDEVIVDGSQKVCEGTEVVADNKQR